MSQRLQDLLEPVVDGLGYELWHLELAGGGRNRLLRLYIDAPGGITLEDCEAVSHEVSAALDVADPLPDAYRLEVSSPGLDRPLVTAAHFGRFVGERARFTLYAPVNGQRRFTATVAGVEGDIVRFRHEGEELTVNLADIAKARLAPELD